MFHKSLLLIDADGDCEPLVAKTADHLGYDLLAVKTSYDAFRILRDRIKQLHLVIVDVDPGAHGAALLEAINACAERPPMIVVTALEESYMGHVATLHGAAACLGKPLRLATLMAAIRELCNRAGLTSNRWGALVSSPAKKASQPRDRFRGIRAKLSPMTQLPSKQRKG